MKICAYVQKAYAKQTYKNECMDTRQFVGLRVVIDCLERAGYTVEYAGMDTVHKYDVVLVSITAFCDWWTFLAERLQWQKGNYNVFVGGAGCLHVEPFLPWVDAFMLGRGEDLIVPLIRETENGARFESESVIYSDTFSSDEKYFIKQAARRYPHPIQLYKGAPWVEGQSGQYKVNWNLIRTTAVDGSSQRLRYGVGKKIDDAVIIDFLVDASRSGATPRIVRIFNIVGYPTETVDDYAELVEVFRKADEKCNVHANGKKWVYGLQNNHFIPYPATPMACAPFSLRDYRNSMIKYLKRDLPKRRLYSGKNLDLVEGQLEEGLSTVLLNVIVARAQSSDWESIQKIAASKKFWRCTDYVKVATLNKYFDLGKICGVFDESTLPSRYLHTYAKVEKLYGKTPLEIEYRKSNAGI